MIARAADVLFAFSADRPHLSLGEIVKRASLPPSTVRRLLVQLTAAGLVEQDDSTRLYSLSLRLARLGAVALGSMDIVARAAPVMRELSAEANEAVLLGQLSAQGVVYLSVVQPASEVRISTQAGDIRPAHSTSIGKALLASLGQGELEAWLASHSLEEGTKNAPKTKDRLLADLEGARARGYAINDRESSSEFASVAAPVVDHEGRTVAALAISSPAYRVPPERIDELGRRVVAAAARLTGQLGGVTAGVRPVEQDGRRA